MSLSSMSSEIVVLALGIRKWTTYIKTVPNEKTLGIKQMPDNIFNYCV